MENTIKNHRQKKTVKQEESSRKMLETLLVSTAIKTIGIVGSTLWVIPLILAGLSYWNYNQLDPESPVVDRRSLYKEYDFVGKSTFFLSQKLHEPVSNIKSDD